MNVLLKALASPDIAPVAENLHQALIATQQAQDDFKIKIDLTKWLKFYRSHRKVLEIYLDSILLVLPGLSEEFEIEKRRSCNMLK